MDFILILYNVYTVSSYTPVLSTFCETKSVTTNCNTTESKTGTLTCSSGQTCQNNACVATCTPTTWSPLPSTVACGTSFTQTNSCTTQSAVGTKCTECALYDQNNNCIQNKVCVNNICQ